MSSNDVPNSEDFDVCCVSCAIMDAAEKLGRHPTPEEMERIYVKTARRAQWQRPRNQQGGE